MLTGPSCQWLTDALAAIVADTTLDGYEKSALFVLAQYAYGRRGECWPSIPTIARGMGFSADTAKRAIARLAQKKRIQITRRPRPGDRHESNVYRLDVCRGVGCSQPPTWGANSTANRISTERSSLLSITKTSSFPPSGGREAAVCSFVSGRVVELAETLFGEHRRRLVISSIRKLVAELGEDVSDDELARFLRYQAKHRNVNRLGAPIAAACDASEFQKWRNRHATTDTAHELRDERPPTRAERERNAIAAAEARSEWLKATRSRPAAKRSRGGGP